MKRTCLIILLLSAALLSSCGVYREYDSAAGAFTDAEGIPQWREFFTDPCLQELVDTALVRNATLSAAETRLLQADESLRAAGLAYLPSLFFKPNGGIAVSSGGDASYSLGLPLSIGWNFGSPGAIFARKHQAQARRIQAQDNLDAVRNELISQIAADYYMLQMLDRKAEILEKTITEWTYSMEFQRDLLNLGKTFYGAVAQMEGKLIDAKQELLKVRADIATLERAVCLLAAEPYRAVRRSAADSSSSLMLIDGEVDFGQLRRRPDVRAAERDLEITYYLTSEARSAFYPSINLTGEAGWPSLVQAALSLVQPIFTQGTIRSRVNISEMDQEIARQQFNQTLLQAATEVSQALADYSFQKDMEALYLNQQEIQAKACEIVGDLTRNGKANYLELIKAQEKLLSAQLGAAESQYKAKEAAIMLYKALGM